MQISRPPEARPVRDEALDELLDAFLDEAVELPTLTPSLLVRTVLLSSAGALAALEGAVRAGLLERRRQDVAGRAVPFYFAAQPSRRAEDPELGIAARKAELESAFARLGAPSGHDEALASRLLTLFQRQRRRLPEDARRLHYDAESRLVLLYDLCGGADELSEALGGVGEAPPSQTPMQQDFPTLERALLERLEEAVDECDGAAALLDVHASLALCEQSLEQGRARPVRSFLDKVAGLLEALADGGELPADLEFPVYDAVRALRQVRSRASLSELPGDPGSQQQPLSERARR